MKGQSILGKPAIFSDSLAKKDFSKLKPVTTQNVSNDFSKPVTAQIRTPQLHQDIRKPNKRVSFSTRVIPTTSVSRPQLKSNQLEDRVMPNNSQRKKQNVEDHRRHFKFSNNKTSVTACNDSLNAKTSNVNFVCVTYGKCIAPRRTNTMISGRQFLLQYSLNFWPWPHRVSCLKVLWIHPAACSFKDASCITLSASLILPSA
ncbi:hypothetical protein Tco_0781511 [Tanacetum coccineum]